MSAPVSAPMSAGRPVRLDGKTLTAGELARVARDPRVRLELDPAAVERVRAGREPIDRIVAAYRDDWAAIGRGESRQPVQDYGLTTGFGEFKDIPLPPGELEAVQRNLLLSHAVGVGDGVDPDDPSSYFPAEVVRSALVLRINAFLGGCSGVRVELVETLVAMVHAGVVPLVPTKGSLGSSGDLCPLAHLFVVLLGEGRYRLVTTPEEAARPWSPPRPASGLAADLGVEPAVPGVKEGLALSNGATFSTALLALAVHDAEWLVATADVAAALALEAIGGCARAFDPKVHAARGHAGQIASAAEVRRLVTGSALVDSAGAVQDPYSVRCAPVVHGAARDAIAYVRGVAEREMNAATDNPLFFAEGDPPWDYAFAANWPPGYDGRSRRSYSAGNFHGEPVAMAADFLAIAVAELANVSERRSQMLLDHHHSRGLPANLVPHRGVNSGLMLAQYTAASLVAENKILAHPASVDSIPTAANVEDHVAMATTAARKLRTIVGNVQATLGIELMVAAQAIEWRVDLRFPAAGGPDEPEPGPPALASFHRADAEARRFARTVAEAGAVAARLGRGTAAAYSAVREVVPPLLVDRVLSDDVRRLRVRVADGTILRAVR